MDNIILDGNYEEKKYVVHACILVTREIIFKGSATIIIFHSVENIFIPHFDVFHPFISLAGEGGYNSEGPIPGHF